MRKNDVVANNGKVKPTDFKRHVTTVATIANRHLQYSTVVLAVIQVYVVIGLFCVGYSFRLQCVNYTAFVDLLLATFFNVYNKTHMTFSSVFIT